MIGVGPHRAAAREHAVHGFREPNCEALHAARQLRVVVGFANEMDMVALDREMCDAEGRARGASERRAKRSEDAPRAQRNVERLRPQRDVDGMPRDTCRSGTMYDARMPRARPPGTFTPSTPAGRDRQRQLSVPGPHLD